MGLVALIVELVVGVAVVAELAALVVWLIALAVVVTLAVVVSELDAVPGEVVASELDTVPKATVLSVAVLVLLLSAAFVAAEDTVPIAEDIVAAAVDRGTVAVPVAGNTVDVAVAEDTVAPPVDRDTMVVPVAGDTVVVPVPEDTVLVPGITENTMAGPLSREAVVAPFEDAVIVPLCVVAVVSPDDLCTAVPFVFSCLSVESMAVDQVSADVFRPEAAAVPAEMTAPLAVENVFGMVVEVVVDTKVVVLLVVCVVVAVEVTAFAELIRSPIFKSVPKRSSIKEDTFAPVS